MSEKDLLFSLNIPDGTVVSDTVVSYDGMAILGNHVQSFSGFHVSNFIAGGGVTVENSVFCSDEFRSDVWCRFLKEVTCRGDAFIGEYTSVDGKLLVSGDLDIGKNVKLNGGFESKGWLVVRNPLPVFLFLFIYVRTLMGLGKSSEEIDKALEDLFEEDDPKSSPISSDPSLLKNVFIVPPGSKITKDAILVGENAFIGKKVQCDLSVYCKSFFSGPELLFRGDIHAKGSVTLSENSRIFGSVKCEGPLIVSESCQIEGDVTAKTVQIDESSSVIGKILAKEGVVFIKSPFSSAPAKKRKHSAESTSSHLNSDTKADVSVPGKFDSNKPLKTLQIPSKYGIRYKKSEKTKFRHNKLRTRRLKR